MFEIDNDLEIVVYTTPTCGPCKALKPELIKLQEIYQFRMRFVELSELTKATFAMMGIRSAPTVACVNGEKTIGVTVGAKSAAVMYEQFVAWGLIREAS